MLIIITLFIGIVLFLLLINVYKARLELLDRYTEIEKDKIRNKLNKNKKMNKVIYSIFSYSLLIILLSTLSLNILNRINNDEAYFNVIPTMLVIKSNSMDSDKLDSFARGDLIFTYKKPDKELIKKGNILSYKNESNLTIVHRVNKIEIINNEYFFT